jgi:hypothetical protein
METAHKTEHRAHSHAAADHHPGHRAKRRSNGRTVNRILSHLPGTDSIGEMAASAADGISEQLTELKEKGMETVEAIDERIVNYPKSSVLLAFAAGYLWARLRKWL